MLTYVSIRPKPLELTVSDQNLALDNIEVLRQNGFEIGTEEGTEGDGDRSRLKLVAQPVSKDTVFDMKGKFIPGPSRVVRN